LTGAAALAYRPATPPPKARRPDGAE